MEWWIVILALFGGFVLLLLTGLPIAFAFGILNVAAILLLVGGGTEALILVAISSYESVSSFAYIAVPLFILMGEVMFHTGLAALAISGIDAWIGRIPGRLAILGTVTGALFGAASGSSMASAGTIGAALIPEMLERRYAAWLALGSVACSGALAILIPPSTLAVIFAGIASMSVGQLLIGGIVPGLIIAFLLCIFIIVVAKLRPDVAPAYELKAVPFLVKIKGLRYLVPIFSLIIIVIGSIFVGMATPSEAAAMGSLGAFVLAGFYKRLTFSNVKNSLLATVRVSVMALLIITTSQVFSQVLAITGATGGLTRTITQWSGHPLVILIGMNVVVFVMGCLIDAVSIMLITIPIFMPIVKALGFDMLWWAIVMMVNIEMSVLTPPFGLNLFVIKSVAPKEISLLDVYRGILPFILVELLAMALMIVFPGIVTWLPALMM